jgi:acyl dehydratase
MKFFDDIRLGDLREFGRHMFTAEEIKRFAVTFDPQPFHMDE